MATSLSVGSERCALEARWGRLSNGALDLFLTRLEMTSFRKLSKAGKRSQSMTADQACAVKAGRASLPTKTAIPSATNATGSPWKSKEYDKCPLHP